MGGLIASVAFWACSILLSAHFTFRDASSLGFSLGKADFTLGQAEDGSFPNWISIDGRGTIFMTGGPPPLIDWRLWWIDTDGYFGLQIPLWIPVAGFGVLSIPIGLRSLRVRGRRKKGCCLNCGYDLRGLTESRCPECSTPFGGGDDKRGHKAPKPWGVPKTICGAVTTGLFVLLGAFSLLLWITSVSDTDYYTLVSENVMYFLQNGVLGIELTPQQAVADASWLGTWADYGFDTTRGWKAKWVEWYPPIKRIRFPLWLPTTFFLTGSLVLGWGVYRGRRLPAVR